MKKKQLTTLILFSLLIFFAVNHFYNLNKVRHSEIKAENKFEGLSNKEENAVNVNEEQKTARPTSFDLCTAINQNPSNEINAINSILVSALEKELKSGATPQELLSYSGQYENFYSSFHKLLYQARMNIEKRKYNFTTRLDTLNEWSGLSVLKGFSKENVPLIIQHLKSLKNQPGDLQLPIEISDKVNKSNILKLAENTDNFNTYLESQLTLINEPIISPSILFILTARNLTLDEFNKILSMHSFTVNEVATAIIHDLPLEYLQPLIESTQLIENTPVIGNDDFFNLADLAASMFNIEALELLDKYGVQPTQQPGVITGLDLAISNLPSDERLYEDLASFPQRYIDTIKYLKDKGYKAHGSLVEAGEDSTVYFKAPYRKNFNSSHVLYPELKHALHDIELISHSYPAPKQFKIDTEVTKAINEVNLRKEAFFACRR